jgi:dihydroxy-acid dehydratase
MTLAEESGRRIVALAERNIRPSDIMTMDAFKNAIRLCMALGGSTNAIIHLVAIAGRLGIELPPALFDELGRTTPCLADLKPTGRHLVHALHSAGGVPVVMKEIESLLHTECLTVTGYSLGENLANTTHGDCDVVRPMSNPLQREGAIAVLRGNLVPRGAILKVSAASPSLLRHEGPAVVFDSYQDMLARIDDPDLDVTADSILVLKNCGPKGVPGMPEWGAIPIPRKLQAAGVHDMVRISDARMSGTSYGTIVLHCCPEAAAGGTLAIIQSGDVIRLDVLERRLDVLLSTEQLAERSGQQSAKRIIHLRGYPKLYIDHVLQCDEGCDFDFLRPRNAEELEFVLPVVGRS